MAADSFVHLHVHSEYSMLDGAARVGELIQAAKDQGMPAVAVTDHGNVFGAYDFWKQATDAGIKPIIGTEAYITPGTHRGDKTRVRWGSGGGDDVSGSGAYTHMTLLSESTTGMHNLFRLSSRASIEGYYFKPRMDRELLSQYSEGLIATTGCPSGEVQTRLRLGQYDEALKAASDYRDIFGRDNYFAEIMDHGLGIEKRIMGDLLRLAKELDLPLVGTNDLHYTHAHDAKSHAALLCVQSGSTLDDPNRFKFDADEFYLKTAAEMRHVFRDHPEACDNTLLIAERCDVKFNTNANYMPRFPVPEGEAEETWFVKEVDRGLARALPGRHPRRGAQAGRLRGRRHPADGVPRLLPRRRRLHQLVEEQRHPGRPRPWVRCRLDGRVRDAHHRPRPAPARAHLRALPEPRPRLDARLRRRLRRASSR